MINEKGQFQLTLPLPGIKLNAVAIQLPRGLDYNGWSETLCKVGQINNATRFWAGDMLVAGEMMFGEMYAQGASDSGFSEDGLSRLRHVSTRIDPERRRKELSWTHHQVVAKFPPDEQDQWLKLAVEKNLTVIELKEAMRKKGHKAAAEETNSEPVDICSCCAAEKATVMIGKKCFKALSDRQLDLSPKAKPKAKAKKQSGGKCK